MIEVKLINPEMTYNIRHKILRPNQTIEDCKFDTDYGNHAFHVGGFYQGKLISIASFCLEQHPDFSIEKQFRLRAMGTLTEYQKLGAGRSIVSFGEKLIKDKGGNFLWCKGRVTAKDYYTKLGFKLHGEVFGYPPIGPHIIMYKYLSLKK